MSKLLIFAILSYVLIIYLFISSVQNRVSPSPKVERIDGKKTSFSDYHDEGGGGPQGPLMGSEYRHLLVFLQISDIHLNMFRDEKRIVDFQDFCKNTIDVINPTVVLASGDLTDGRYANDTNTGQFQEEWIKYREALDSAGVLKKTTWLDMRGNHDNFNVDSWRSSFYLKYAVQGKQNGSYMHTIVPKNEGIKLSPSERYTFVAVDAALSPGPKAPWNFYGSMNERRFEQLRTFEIESRKSNGTIWFGHYPTSFIVMPSKSHDLRTLMSNAAAYLCGHLHTLFGLAEQMYARQHSGLLELELGDFKLNKRYRIGVFDHGVFAFSDVTLNRWPVIVVTNPKDVLFSDRKSINSARESTHLRILAFSPTKIQAVTAQIDNGVWINCHQVKGSLFVAPWNTTNYSTGLHTIKVISWDEEGRKASVTQHFAFDGSTRNFGLPGRLALMIDAAALPYAIYFIVTILVIIPLSIVRLLHTLVKDRTLSFQGITRGLGAFGTRMLRFIWVTCSVNKMLVPLVFGPLYWPFGVWQVRQMLNESHGIAFAWGTYIQGQWLPPSLDYVLDGTVQLIFFQLPFMVVLMVVIDRKFQVICWKQDLNLRYNQLAIALLFCIQFAIAETFYVYTQHPLLFLGHLQIYTIIYAVTLWYFYGTLEHRHFFEAEIVWKKPKRKTSHTNSASSLINTRNGSSEDN